MEPRVGVFVCECGGNISDVVNVPRVVEEASRWEGVVVAKNYTYLCSKPGIELIRNTVRRKKLDRVVLACCTPKMHRKMFEENLQREGLNPAMLEMVNIREQCSWVHADDPEGATLKALDSIRGAVEKVKNSVPLKPGKMEVRRSVLVVGGGVAGITASLRLAGYGLKVYLVEKSPSIGGHMIKYPKVFPTLDCAQCILAPKMAEVSTNPNITLYTCAEVCEVSGVPGDFKCKIRLRPRGVDVEKCVGCGVCSKVCPVKVPNEFDEGLGVRSAIYIPFPQSVPLAAVVDFDSCVKCRECLKVCPAKAIDLEDQEKIVEVNVGAIIVATGFKLYDPKKLPQFGFGKYPNVITSLQMERLMHVGGPTGSEIVVPGNRRPVKSVAYVLCAGSRDLNQGVPYCSRVCCLYALKQAIMLRDRGIDVWVHYIDIRAPGRRYEEFYRQAQEKGVRFIKGKVAEIVPEGDKVIVRGEDMMINKMVENPVDLVVLCPPVVVDPDTLKLAEILRVPVDEDGFILEKHPKLDPVATKREGIFGCGMAMGPKDIQTTTAEAEAAAMKAVEFLSKARAIEPNKAFLKHPDLCDGCGVCVDACSQQAISIQDGKAVVNEIVCNGCGACIPSCPKRVLDLRGLTEEQLYAQIRGILRDSNAEWKILVFMEENIVYTAADLAGVARLTYPSSVRVIPLPSASRLRLEHILYAFAHGADGVMVLEAPEKEAPLGRAHIIAEDRIMEYRDMIEDYGIDGIRLWFSRVYVPDWRKLAKIFKTFETIIKDEGHLENEVKRELLELFNSNSLFKPEKIEG